MISTVALLCLLAAEPLKVAVLPVAGEGAPPSIGPALAEALRSLPELTVLALSDAESTLGKEAFARLAAAHEEAAALRTLRALSIAADRLVLGEVSDKGRLELRLVDSSTRTLIRISRDLPVEPGARRREVSLAAIQLFPDRQAQAVATLSLACEVSDLALFIDDQAIAGCPASVRLSPGPHEVRATAPGRHRFRSTLEAAPGAELSLAVELPKNRSPLPLYLGLGALGVAGLGTYFGLSANATASDWVNACGASGCAPGFTRLRYEGDDRALTIRRVTSGGLFVIAGGLLATAIVSYVLDPGSEDEP